MAHASHSGPWTDDTTPHNQPKNMKEKTINVFGVDIQVSAEDAAKVHAATHPTPIEPEYHKVTESKILAGGLCNIWRSCNDRSKVYTQLHTGGEYTPTELLKIAELFVTAAAEARGYTSIKAVEQTYVPLHKHNKVVMVRQLLNELVDVDGE